LTLSATLVCLSLAPAVLGQGVTRYAFGGNNQSQKLVPAPDGSLFTADFNGAVARIAPNGDVTRVTVGVIRRIVAGSDGNMWAAETGAIYRISPDLSQVFGVNLEWSGTNITVALGPDGNVWALKEDDQTSGSNKTYHPELASITPSGTVTKYPLAQERYRDLVVGPDGKLWCSHDLPGGGFALTTISTGGEPTDVPVNINEFVAAKIAGPDGNFWCFANGILKIAPDGTVLEEYPIPYRTGIATPPGPQMTFGPDGNLWFVNTDYIAKLVIADGTRWTYTDPSAGGSYARPEHVPSGIAVGSDGMMWVVERYYQGMIGFASAEVMSTGAIGPNATPAPNTAAPAILTFDTSLPMTQILLSKAGIVCNIDGDYSSDVVWRNSVTGDNAIWYFKGGAGQNTSIRSVPNVAWKIAGSGDFDGDGHADLFWRNSETGYTAVWLERGGDFTNVPGPLVSLDWSPRGVADVDGDGKADVVWRNGGTGENAIWLMDGGDHTNVPLPAVTDTEWSIRAVSDFDRDGFADFLWKRSSGETAIWYMDATLAHTNVPMPTVGPGWEPVGSVHEYVFWRNSDLFYMTSWDIANRSTLYNQGMYVPNRMKDPAWKVVATGDFGGQTNAIWRGPDGTNVLWPMPFQSYYQEIPLATVSDTTWEIAAPR